MNITTEFDVGSLTWVKAEIDLALEKAKKALQDYAEDLEKGAGDSDTRLKFCRTHLHQAHGALAIVGLDGVTRLTESLEQLLLAMEQGGDQLSEAASVVEAAIDGISQYLDQLIGGEPDQPLKLFPLYRDIQAKLGRQHVSPTDLFFPDLSQRPPRRAYQALPLSADALASLLRVERGSFQRGLLQWLRGNRSGLSQMLDAVRKIEAAQDNPLVRTFWWISLCFVTALAEGSINDEVEVKQLCARIDLQIRRLMEGSRNVAESLMRDELYFIANASSNNQEIQQAKDVFKLRDLIPSASSTLNTAPEIALLRRVREMIPNAEESWGKFCAGAAQFLSVFSEQIESLVKFAHELGQPDLIRLLEAISALLSRIEAQPQLRSEMVSMEVATALLLVQDAQENFSHLGAEFPQQVDTMVRRLQTSTDGEVQACEVDLGTFDDITRRAQEKLLLGQVAREIQTNLAKIEQTLDAFFRDPAKRTDLTDLRTPINQILGALTILHQNAAVKALQECTQDIDRFASSDYSVQEGDFEHVAHQLSLLGFFIDELQHGSIDYETFVRGLNKKPEALADDGIQAEETISVEAELEQQKREAQVLLDAYREKPSDFGLREELKQSLQTLKKDADLIADKTLGMQAKAALSVLEGAEEEPRFDPALSTFMPTAPEMPKPSEETIQLSQASTEELDAEFLAIFLEEANEVLATIDESLKELETTPNSVETLTTIRRSFHTLKGSGRMVGLKDLGEVAWEIEQTMNLWLRQELGLTPVLHEMLKKAHYVFASWVRYLEKEEPSIPDATELVDMAKNLRANDSAASIIFPSHMQLVDDQQIQSQDMEIKIDEPTPAVDLEEKQDGLPLSMEDTLVVDLLAKPLELIDQNKGMPAALLASMPGMDRIVDHDPVEPTTLHFDEPLIGPIDLDDAVEETIDDAQILNLNDLQIDQEEVEPASPPDPDVFDISFSNINIPSPPESPVADMESTEFNGLDFTKLDLESDAEPVVLPDVEAPKDISASIEPVLNDDGMADQFGEIPSLDQPRDVTASNFGFNDFDFSELGTEDEPSSLKETLPEPVSRQVVTVSPTLYAIFLEEARGHMETLHREFAVLEAMPSLHCSPSMVRAAHTLAGIAGTVGIKSINRLGLSLEHVLQRRDISANPGSAQALVSIRMAISMLDEMSTAVSEGRTPEEDPNLLEILDSLYPLPEEAETPAVAARFTNIPSPVEQVISLEISEPAHPLAIPLVSGGKEEWHEKAVPPRAVVEADTTAVVDEIDEQLLPVFLEEAQELSRSVSEQLLAWRQSLSDLEIPKSVARSLHTLKGNARMAGAMNLGEMTHAIESRVSEARESGASLSIIDDIETRFDALVQIIEHLQRGETLPENIAGGVSATGVSVSTPLAAMETLETDADKGALLRVRADLIDRLVNEAGELSIARARIEGEMRSLKDSLLDLTENVIRLRRQVREIEIQAETQIQSRIAQAQEVNSEFDPLELDRFTHFQELTRMMAESVNDVATVQQNLLKNLDDANAALVAQSRLNREHSQALMGVRMVPFASQVGRLYRTVRQTAKQVNKRANLDIQGRQVEIDRSVLDSILAPLEHMLRNSVTHGIESKEVRLERGKPEIGEISIKLTQEGNEIVLVISDDGTGLDFERIRTRAIAEGTLKADEEVNSERLVDLIFRSGFSTAQQLTQESGRGVGLDVVKTGVTNLGGRIEVSSVKGQGTAFRIYLPLTLSLMQTLLVRTGIRVYAVPSTMIEQVLELKSDVLDKIRQAGEVEWMHNHYPFRFMPHLLGEPASLPEAHRLSPVLLLKSGSQRLAVQVDELQGNQEVVVKNIGPQLSRIIGIVGATVLGDGQVILIMNPVALATRVQTISVVMEAPFVPAEQPMVTLPTVMVVDDSLTVRKIAGRLLAREGYHVLTAKDGVDALEQMLDVVPDVMMVDIEMPRMDGFDLTRNVRADSRLKDIPIIMITSRTADKHRNYAKEIGVNHYLGKPYQEEELLGLVKTYMQERRK